MTKKLLSVLVILTLVLGLTAAFALESSAASIALIYESATDPVIDGVVDSEGYRLICETGSDPTGNLKTWEGCTVDDTMQLYACWKGDYLYLAVKVVCNGDHVAYMDNASEHWIFNAHYMMTCMCPGDPYQEVYKGDNEDGTWTWGALNTASHVWEWTIINPSQETDSDISDHFRTMSAQEGFEYKVTTADGYDTYEQKIPLSKVVNSTQAGGIKGEVGSLFGLGFMIGLTDVGTGYVATDDEVYFSDYFTGDKYINGMAYCKLASDIDHSNDPDTSEPEAPTAIDEQYDIFPQLDGLWTKTDSNGSVIDIAYSAGTTVISGSTTGTYPSAVANFPKTVYVGEGTSLVYDLSFEVGKTSIRLNGQNYVHTLMSDNLEASTQDLLPGSYKGAITYEQLVELLGADENGLVAITDMTVFTVDGAEIAINTFKFDPSYVPPTTDDTSDDVSEPATDDPSDTPTTDPSDDKSDESVPANDSDAPTTSDDASEEKGGNTGLIIGIVVAVVVVVAIVVVVVVVSKKKKA